MPRDGWRGVDCNHQFIQEQTQITCLCSSAVFQHRSLSGHLTWLLPSVLQHSAHPQWCKIIRKVPRNWHSRELELFQFTPSHWGRCQGWLKATPPDPAVTWAPRPERQHYVVPVSDSRHFVTSPCSQAWKRTDSKGGGWAHPPTRGPGCLGWGPGLISSCLTLGFCEWSSLGTDAGRSLSRGSLLPLGASCSGAEALALCSCQAVLLHSRCWSNPWTWTQGLTLTCLFTGCSGGGQRFIKTCGETAGPLSWCKHKKQPHALRAALNLWGTEQSILHDVTLLQTEAVRQEIEKSRMGKRNPWSWRRSLLLFI